MENKERWGLLLLILLALPSMYLISNISIWVLNFHLSSEICIREYSGTTFAAYTCPKNAINCTVLYFDNLESGVARRRLLVAGESADNLGIYTRYTHIVREKC